MTVRTLWLAGVSALGLLAAPALASAADPQGAGAQTADAQAQAAPPPTAPAGAAVEELVVTARRTAENLQTVPVAISAFSQTTLDRQGARDATDLQGLVPNLNIVQGRGSPDAANIYIRGLGQPDALQTFDPAVGVYIDDLYVARIRGVLFNLYDLERVEVLRGPQGTLFGKNTIGGALRYITRKPGQDPYAYASFGVGDYGEIEGKFSAMGPINRVLAGGVSAYYTRHDGYVHDLANGREYNDANAVAARAQLAFTPTDSFRLDLSADFSHEDTAMNLGQPSASLYRLNLVPPAGLGAVTVLYPGQTSDQWNYEARASTNLPNRTPLNAQDYIATAEWRPAEAWRLRSITGYRHLNYDDSIDIDASPYQLGDAKVGVNDGQFSQELQANYEAGRLKAVGGVFFMREHVGSTQYAFGNDLYTLLGAAYPAVRYIGDKLDTTTYAGYLNATWSVTDKLRLTGGLRYTDEDKHYARGTRVNGGAPFAFDVDKSWDDVSGLASLDYQLTPTKLVYARFSQGFQSGGFNGRSNNPGEQQPYDPETVNTYEAGAKTEWLDHRLRANLAVFYNDYKDFQARVSRSVPDPAGAANPPIIALTVLNAGALETYGAELDLLARVTRAFTLDAQVGWLHAGYDTFNDDQFKTAANPTGDRSFQTPAFSPEWTARLGAAYEFDLSDFGRAKWGYVTVAAAASYRSRMALAVDNTNTAGVEYGRLFQGDYTLYDARIVWESPDRKYSAGVYGKNLGDRLYKTDAQEFSSVAGIQTVYYGAPSTVMFRVTGRFY